MGNITSNASTVGSDNRATDYRYVTATNSRPHAVSEVTINGVLTKLSYNANGAITSYDATGIVSDKHIAYNSSNQPTVINVGASSITDTNYKARDEFRYAPDGQRYYRRSSFVEAGIARTEHTYYVNGYELTVFDPSSSFLTSSRIQIGKLQIVQNTPKSGSVTTIQNTLLVDHQGSITGIVASGSPSVNMAYEVFGLRRSPTLLTNLTAAEFTNISSKVDKPTTNSYTNHEMLDRTGFIHMNGRVYDPLLGRFLSPDPIVQDPDNSQSWNRYSYVFNNPLKYIDPTGYSAVEESPPAIGVRCGEACQRKGQADTFFYMIHTATSRGGVWESYGNNLYNTATREGAMLMDIARGLSQSNAYLKIAVNGGGSKTNTNNVLGALASTQLENPAIAIARDALIDKHLTHGEANKIWRANNDPTFEVTVDAGRLTVLQQGEFNSEGTAPGRIAYSHAKDWLVHGSVTLSRDSIGRISILPGAYDFQPHTPARSIRTKIRNIETFGGFFVASRGGLSSGTDYIINYSGHPNVIR